MAAAKGRAVSIQEADRFAATVLPIMQEIQKAGVSSPPWIGHCLE
ncbi:hypothetical protein ACG873_10395 [Mesorhizobium sp. AaZ16]